MNKKLYYISLLTTILILIAGVFLKQFLPVFMEVAMPCVLYTATGWYCPGCGGTRAVLSLLNGHLIQSFCHHPVVLYTVAVYGWFMVSNTIELLSKGKCKIAMKPRVVYLWIALGIVIVQCVFKNIFLR